MVKNSTQRCCIYEMDESEVDAKRTKGVHAGRQLHIGSALFSARIALQVGFRAYSCCCVFGFLSFLARLFLVVVGERFNLYKL